MPHHHYLMARFWIITAVLAALLGSVAHAQDAVSRRPGYWYDGTNLGYVPGHERRANEARAASQARSSAAAVAAQSEVEPASYYEQEAVAPNPSFPIDSSWEGAGCCYQTVCYRPPIYLRAELLSWWIDDMNLPPLVTTSPLGTPTNTAGVLGQPGTQILFGDDQAEAVAHLGGRFTAGRWLDPCECVAFEASYFFLGPAGTDFAANGFDRAILARPFFSTQTNAEAARLVAYPNLLEGSIDINTSSQMQGFDALLRVRGCSNLCTDFTFLAGYRYLNLDESLRINQLSRFTVAQGVIVAGTEQRLFDQFSTENHFHGAQIGFASTTQYCCWSLDTQVKFALGNTHSEVTIDGRTRTTVPNGGSATFVGGLLAQESNIGRRTRDELAFVPELTLTLRREIACNLQFVVGYNVLYWTGAARLGDQIDTAVSQFPPEPPTGAGRPRFDFDSSGVLVQGLQLGLDFSF